MKISFGNADEQKQIKITKEGIHKVFGYPNGTQKSAPRPQTSTNSMKKLISELGLKSPNFSHEDLLNELR
jgi:hypothetical protein